MSFKVVRVDGVAVAFGPNEDHYEPGMPYVIEADAPTITPSIQSQIHALDGGDPMARPTREFMILSLEKEALAAGYTVAQLRASHYGYRKVKELDEQIAALRAQL
jgi:hypothetical protein